MGLEEEEREREGGRLKCGKLADWRVWGTVEGYGVIFGEFFGGEKRVSSGELYSVMRFFVYEDFEDEIFNI